MASIIKANQLQDFGGNSILTSDGAGVVTPNASGIKNTPAFYAYVNGSAQSVSNDTFTKVTLAGTLLDTDSAFSSNKFTVPSGQAGNYFLSGSAGYDSATDWDVHFVLIYKNGTSISKASNRQEYDTLNKTSVVTTLAVGDYIELYVRQIQGGSQNLRTASDEVYLQGFKLIGA
tara:strand:- start:144 stop:665 length:522 start_codon:yes stop_codon:yes gene_type:complete